MRYQIKKDIFDFESDIQESILQHRGLLEQKNLFVSPDFDKHTHNPFDIFGMEKAVVRILDAISRLETVAIFSDYDCDGIPAMVVLSDFFKKINYENILYYTPHRHKEGYGLNIQALDYLIQQSVSLIITVDLGITNIEEVGYAKERGVDVIVTDHHLPHVVIEEGIEKEVLPPAYQVINTKQAQDTYKEKMLCGCAIAWKIVCAVLQYVRERRYVSEHEYIKSIAGIPLGWEKWLLDMVGISTIADMVPLTGENRTLAYYGIKVLQKSRRAGLKALLLKARAKQELLTEDDIAFTIAPRLNAASRMDSPEVAFRLLSTTDHEEAEELAHFLEKLNTSRKESVGSIMKDVYSDLVQDDQKKVIVIGNPAWTPGILGLIASKVLDTYKKPVFVWGAAEQPDQFKGSCRSDGSVNVVDLMRAIKDEVFVHVGGHELAGGFSVYRERIHELEQMILDAYENVKKINYIETKNIFIDGSIHPTQVSHVVMQKIDTLAPYGMGNQRPTFLLKDVEVVSLRHFGKGNSHLELVVSSHETQVKAYGYFVGSHSFEKTVGVIEVGKRISIVGQLERDMYGSRKNVKVRIIDVI